LCLSIVGVAVAARLMLVLNVGGSCFPEEHVCVRKTVHATRVEGHRYEGIVCV
jgi:hypothetical protein